MRNTLQ
ncbi:hypothetical protein YPPY03_4611, partial [Yersinia pestis PY-03]